MNKLILSISIIASITFFSCDGKRAEEQKDNTDSVKVESTQAKTQAQEGKETYTSDDANLTSKAGEILAEATQDAKGKSESVKSSIKNVVKQAKSEVKSAVSETKDAFKSNKEDVKSSSSETKEEVKSSVKDAKEEVKSSVNEAKDEVTNGVKSVFNETKDALFGD